METLKKKAEKILIVQSAFLGDAVLTLPMIQKLKEMNAGSLIDILCIPASEEIFRLSPFINDILIIDKKGQHKSIFSFLKFVKQIKAREYDKIYSPHRSFRTSILVMQSAVKETYGFSNSSLPHVYKYLTEYILNHHEVQRNLDLIGYDYFEDGWKILPEININQGADKVVNQFLKDNNITSDFAGIAPGSIWNTKKYPLEYYEKIIVNLIASGLKIVLIGGKDEMHMGASLEAKYKGGLISSAGIMSITESIALLKHSKILISNDSAPAHLGICADIPVLTLFCSTVPDFGFYPYNNSSRWLSYSELDCKPCGIHGYDKCPLKHFKCGYNLEPDLVISTVRDMLNDK